MILTELHGYKQYLDKDFYELMNLLKTHADINDNGRFSTIVIPRSGEHVYKIWTNDEGYETYYNIAKRLQGNKFVPKLGLIRKLPIFFKRPDTVDGYLKIVKLEKLKPFNDRGLGIALAEFIRFFVSEKIELTSFKQEHAGNDVKRFVDGRRAYKSAPNLYKFEVDDLETSSDDLFELAHALRSAMINNEDLCFDMHSGNIMLRGSQPVITDPFCLTGDSEDHQRHKGVLFMNHLGTNIDAIADAFQRGKYATAATKTGNRPRVKP
jgi:hypothetical protein